MKESLSAIPKQAVFRETFTDEQTTRLNGGVPTAVTYFNGVASFNGSTSFVSYNKPFNGTYSVRFKFYTYIPAIGTTKMLLDNRLSSGSGYIYDSNSNLSVSSGNKYINGVLASALSNTTTEIVVSGISFNSAISLISKNYLNGEWANHSIELVEIYDYTLTANEVKNLYEGKRNRIIDLKQTATSIDNYYQGVGVSGNYVSTPNAAANNNNGDKEFKIYIDLANIGTHGNLVQKDDAGSNRGYAVFYDTSSRAICVYAATDLTSFVSSLMISSAVLSVGYKGWFKITLQFISGTLYCNFYTSSDNITYTQLGVQRSITGNNLVNLGAPLILMERTGVATGSKLYRATIANSIGGNPVVDFDPTRYVSGTTFTASTGEVWTINGTQGFIGNGSRPEILNIDGRNGVIANKYNPENLLTYSNTLSTVDWTKINVTAAGGQVSPTTLNNEGWLLNKSATGVDGTIENYFITTNLTPHIATFNILKDDNETRFPELFLRLNTGEVYQYVMLNTKTGAMSQRSFSVGTTYSSTLSADGLWWKVILTNPAPTSISADNRWGVRPAAGTVLGVYNINATGSVITYGAQVNTKTIKPYIQTFATNITSNLINTAVTPVRQGSVWGMDFNGTTSKLDCGNYDSLLGDVTVAFWLKDNDVISGTPKFVFNGNFILYSNMANKRVGLTSNNFTNSGASGNAAVLFQAWKLIVITRTSTGVTNFYIDGILQGTANQATGAPVAGTTNLIIGNSSISDAGIRSRLSQIRIIKGILNAQECQQLFDNERHDYNI